MKYFALLILIVIAYLLITNNECEGFSNINFNNDDLIPILAPYDNVNNNIGVSSCHNNNCLYPFKQNIITDNFPKWQNELSPIPSLYDNLYIPRCYNYDHFVKPDCGGFGNRCRNNGDCCKGIRCVKGTCKEV